MLVKDRTETFEKPFAAEEHEPAPLGLQREPPHGSRTDAKSLPMQTKSVPIKPPRGLSYEVQSKSKDFPSFLPTKTPGNKCGLSLYKFHSCVKAPELSPPSKIKQQPDMKNNIVKIVQLFSVHHALKIKISSVKDI